MRCLKSKLAGIICRHLRNLREERYSRKCELTMLLQPREFCALMLITQCQLHPHDCQPLHQVSETFEGLHVQGIEGTVWQILPRLWLQARHKEKEREAAQIRQPETKGYGNSARIDPEKSRRSMQARTHARRTTRWVGRDTSSGCSMPGTR